MKKIIECPGCGEKKPHHALGFCAQCYGREYTRRWRAANRDRWLSRMRRYGAQWRAENPAKIKAQKQRQYQRKKAKRLAIIQEQVGMVCIDCGENRPAALEYHHKGGAESMGHYQTMTWKQFNKELPKLEALCGTCHNIRHRG